MEQLPQNSAYWVCAYANNQHELGAEIATDPRVSSFAKAIAICDGVLLILDGKATPFSRIWCCFEEALVVESGAALRLDIATTPAPGRKAELLTEGLAPAERLGGEDEFSAAGWVMKTNREKAFPTDLLKIGFEIDITKANASMAIDRVRILNAIKGAKTNAELDAEPDMTNAAYGKINNVLRGIFAETAVPKAGTPEELGRALAVLREDTARRRVRIEVRNSPVTDLPRRVVFAVERMTELETLLLDLSGAASLTSVAELQELAKLRRLTSLTILLRDCWSMEDQGLNAAISSFGALPLKELVADLRR